MDEKVTPLLLVIVKAFRLLVLPTAPVMVAVLSVLRVKFAEPAVVMPSMVLVKLIGVATPVPTVNVLLSAIVVAPKVI